ncbi:MAG: phospholipase D-like domain-containing protein [Lachnospiraceae bacterium]|nr:phospholipase D-like domain-containing protein [Lachnospiraceae bacterium]
MTEKEFQRLLIEMVRRNNHPEKKQLLNILERASLSCDKTNVYTRQKWNHYQEYIYITVEPSDLLELMKYKKYIEQVIEQIYPVNDDYEYELFGVELKPGSVTRNEFTSQEIHFEDIQQQIINELRDAKYTIWIAMAWFTNKELFDELVKKKNQGVNIQVVLDDNERNSQAPFKLEDEFETYRVTIQSYYKNIMHDKFCVIDLKTAIHGTFNWTNAANYNKETVSIDKNSATARVFADEFIKLKTQIKG